MKRVAETAHGQAVSEAAEGGVLDLTRSRRVGVAKIGRKGLKIGLCDLSAIEPAWSFSEDRGPDVMSASLAKYTRIRYFQAFGSCYPCCSIADWKAMLLRLPFACQIQGHS